PRSPGQTAGIRADQSVAARWNDAATLPHPLREEDAQSDDVHHARRQDRAISDRGRGVVVGSELPLCAISTMGRANRRADFLSIIVKSSRENTVLLPVESAHKGSSDPIRTPSRVRPM